MGRDASKLLEGTHCAFAHEPHALGAAATHAHEAAEAERVHIRLQTKFCGVEVALKERERWKRAREPMINDKGQ
jgi:hypothetical protein